MTDLSRKTKIVDGLMRPIEGTTLTDDEVREILHQNTSHIRAEMDEASRMEAALAIAKSEDRAFVKWCLKNRSKMEAFRKIISRKA